MQQPNNYTATDIFEQAISVVNSLDSGTEFILKDLFTGVIWNEFQKSERLSVGTLFKNAVTGGVLQNKVENTGKSSSNSAVYKRK
ncbi:MULTISPECIES: single-stranded DNA-binding protein [Periweissella]|uniref:Single-stranded DNA-binding protein n=1 Tax=Periweissella fabalis TaxID=1070421 RepID=A0A7X6S469_9LACO|nr:MULTISPECIES: single-stranded DNA-binding protein [Periweissella]MCM0598432.1 single-stranded DNA-binding protein [Periweissella fabalis]MCT4396853.1 single-stranded DNA-binding protein [Periweissella beninensis]NKZ24966.1 single-stranded DNA-binding protein [Periweissella fabalis]